MNDDLQANIILVIIIGLALYFFVWRKLGGHWTAELTLPNGHTYPYMIGDHIRSYRVGGEFNGINVVLPKQLPHIYLDSLRAGGRHVRFVIGPAQRIDLEGNFGRDYQVFVPKGHETVALSILSPDVMSTLQRYATAFDVEVFGDQVRVISNKRVSNNKALQEALLAVALKVTAEIDHRLASWNRSGSLASHEQDLHMYPGAGFRMFGRYVTYWVIGWTVYWLFACIGLAMAAVAVLIDPEQSRGLGIFLLSLFAVIFALTVTVTVRRWRTDSFYSKRGWGIKGRKR
jgi:hypothetical protein